MEKIKGFTILEALITLTIVCFISLIGTLQLKDYQQKVVFNNSIDRFNAALEQASRVATIHSERISIDYMRQSHTMYLQGNKGYHRKLNFDETMEISQIYDYVISSSGMSRPKKIVFSDGKHKRIENIQMAWGRELLKAKGFMMVESMVGIAIAFLGMMIFSLVFIDSQKNEQRIEKKTDQALAERIMRENKIDQIMIHDHIYTVNENEEK